MSKDKSNNVAIYLKSIKKHVGTAIDGVTNVDTKNAFSLLKKLNIEDNDNIEDNIIYYPGITLLFIISNFSKKSKKTTPHGYYIASGLVQIMALINSGNDNVNAYSEIIVNMYNCVVRNLSSVYNNDTNMADNDKLDLHNKCLNYVNKKIFSCMQIHSLEKKVSKKKSDLIIKSGGFLEKYQKLELVSETNILNYIKSKYGSLFQLSYVLGWYMGISSSNNQDMIKVLETIGQILGVLYKVTYDFMTIDDEIKELISTDRNYSDNIIINCGIKKSFSIFVEQKTKFIEESMEAELYIVNIRVILAKMEDIVNDVIENSDFTSNTEASSFR